MDLAKLADDKDGLVDIVEILEHRSGEKHERNSVVYLLSRVKFYIIPGVYSSGLIYVYTCILPRAPW